MSEGVAPASAREPSRRAVKSAPSRSLLSIQPKLAPGLFTQGCTSVTRSGVEPNEYAPIPPSRWIGYSEKFLNYTSLGLAVLFFGLVLALAPTRRPYKPPVPQRDSGRFPSYEESRRLAPLFDKLREAERKRAQTRTRKKRQPQT